MDPSYHKKYYLENKERIISQAKNWSKNNPERRKEKSKIYYQKVKDKKKEQRQILKIKDKYMFY